jgi:MYXO-CTERM domain-containing protein
MLARLPQISVFVILGASFACSGKVGVGGFGEATQKSSNKIIGGTRASGYEEAALVDMYQNGQLTAACSGSIIAPRVVLTAGHCVDGFTSWGITAPYSNRQTANASSGATYDWMENGATTVNPNHHDIGLIFLDTPITLSSFPKLAKSRLADNSNVVNIGRINNGTLSDTDLFVSSPIPVVDGSTQGFPFDYAAQQVIQEGDSGGPDEVPGSTPHLIVAVNSGAGSGEVLARVDLLYSWIQQQIQAHGGGGGGGGTPPDAGTTPPPPPPHDAGTTGQDSGGGGGTTGSDSGSGGSGGGGGGGGAGDSGAGGSGDDAGGNGAQPSDNSSGQWMSSGSNGGCAMGGSSSQGGALAIGLAALVMAARRRRR